MKISSFTCRSSTVIGWLILPLIKILDFFFLSVFKPRSILVFRSLTSQTDDTWQGQSGVHNKSLYSYSSHQLPIFWRHNALNKTSNQSFPYRSIFSGLYRMNNSLRCLLLLQAGPTSDVMLYLQTHSPLLRVFTGNSTLTRAAAPKLFWPCTPQFTTPQLKYLI